MFPLYTVAIVVVGIDAAKVTVEDVIAATNIITVITIVKNFFISFLLIIIYI